MLLWQHRATQEELVMPKKGELKPMDVFEERIRAEAVAYNVTGFKPGSSTKVYESATTLDEAKARAVELLTADAGLRSAMVYAIDKEQHHALVGTVFKDLMWRPVKPKRY